MVTVFWFIHHDKLFYATVWKRFRMYLYDSTKKTCKRWKFGYIPFILPLPPPTSFVCSRAKLWYSCWCFIMITIMKSGSKTWMIPCERRIQTKQEKNYFTPPALKTNDRFFFCFSYKVIFHHHHTWKPYWKIEKEWTGRKKTSEDQDSEKFQIAKEILWKLTFKHTRCMELFANWNSFFFLVSGIFFLYVPLLPFSVCVCLYCAFSHELNRIVLNLTG